MSLFEEAKIAYEIVRRKDLSSEESRDLDAAIEARESAYAPYSKFLVGASIRSNSGEVVTGWNAENIVHHSLHAEENAIGNLSAAAREAGIKRVVIVGGLLVGNHSYTSPCGGCRQKLMEFAGKDTDIIMSGTDGDMVKVKLQDLLPFGFFPAEVKK